MDKRDKCLHRLSAPPPPPPPTIESEKRTSMVGDDEGSDENESRKRIHAMFFRRYKKCWSKTSIVEIVERKNYSEHKNLDSLLQNLNEIFSNISSSSYIF